MGIQVKKGKNSKLVHFSHDFQPLRIAFKKIYQAASHPIQPYGILRLLHDVLVE